MHSIPVLLYFIQFHDQNQEINESSPRLSLFVILFSNSLMILHILYLYFNRIYERISIQNSLNQLEPGREFNKASVDQLFTERIDSVQIEEKYKSAKKIHIVIVSLLTFSLLLFYFMMGRSLNLLSPILIAVIISSFIIVAFELFISAQFLLCQIAISICKHRKIPFLRFEIYKMGVIIASILILSSYFFASINPSYIRTEVDNNITKETNQQDSLESYLDAWYQNKITTKVFNQEDSNVLYLISGQGGGSRAGTWFLFNMGKFESLDQNFYEKIFSISAVSGSISGANMYLAAKNFQVFPKVFADSVLPHQDQTKELNHLKAFAKIIYGTNYISSGILGLPSQIIL